MVLNTSFFITLYSETHESLTKLELRISPFPPHWSLSMPANGVSRGHSFYPSNISLSPCYTSLRHYSITLKPNSLHEKRAEILLSVLGFCLNFWLGWIPTLKAVSSWFSGNRLGLVGISIVYCLLTYACTFPLKSAENPRPLPAFLGSF